MILRDCLASIAAGAAQRVSARDITVLERYFGLCGDAPQTLEEIGRALGITRERTRQLRDRALERLSESAAREEPIGHDDIRATLDECCGLARFEEMAERVQSRLSADDYSAKAYLAFAVRRALLTNVWEAGNSLLVSSRINREKLLALLSDIAEMIKESEGVEFASIQGFVESASLWSDEEAHEMITRTLLVDSAVEVLPGLWSARAWTLPDYAAFVLETEARPMHFSEIAARVSVLCGRKVAPPGINNKLNGNPRFARVGNGDFVLASPEVQTYTRFDEVIACYLKRGRKAEHVRTIADALLDTYTVRRETIETLMRLRKESFFGYGGGYFGVRGQLADAQASIIAEAKKVLLEAGQPLRLREMVNKLAENHPDSVEEIERTLYVRPEFSRLDQSRNPRFALRDRMETTVTKAEA